MRLNILNNPETFNSIYKERYYFLETQQMHKTFKNSIYWTIDIINSYVVLL